MTIRMLLGLTLLSGWLAFVAVAIGLSLTGACVSALTR